MMTNGSSRFKKNNIDTLTNHFTFDFFNIVSHLTFDN